MEAAAGVQETTGIAMNDRIIEFLRASPGGVSSLAIAERFLKLKAPVGRLAHAMVAGVLKGDRRCALGDDGLWRATKVVAQEVRLRDMPWSAVAMLSDGRRLLHVSAWTVFPEPRPQFALWLADPAGLAPEEQEVLRSARDLPFDLSGRDEALASAAAGLAERVPLYLSMGEESLLGWHCSAVGAALTDSGMALSHLFRGADVELPRPMELSACCALLTGRRPLAVAAADRGRLVAECAAELVERLEQAGVETREALEARLDREIAAFDFTGKQFTAETIAALRTGPGVYGFKDRTGACIYIGKAANVRRRVGGYFRRTEESPAKLERLRADGVELTVHACGSELECLILEHRLILKHKPRLNTQTEITERKGVYRPPDDCVVLLPHAEEGRGMAVWFRRGQKIQLKPFATDWSAADSLAAALQEFFYTPRLQPSFTDFAEQEIAQRWLSRRMDDLPVVPASRLASGQEILDAMRGLWREVSPGG